MDEIASGKLLLFAFVRVETEDDAIEHGTTEETMLTTKRSCTRWRTSRKVDGRREFGNCIVILDALAIPAPPHQHVEEIDHTKRLLFLFLGVSTEQDAIEHSVQNRRTSNIEDRKMLQSMADKMANDGRGEFDDTDISFRWNFD